MGIFEERFIEANRTNRTSRSRWNAPTKDAQFKKPDWQPIERVRKNRQVQMDDAPEVSASESEESPVQTHHIIFDEHDLARVAAKIAWQARQEGEALCHEAAITDQNMILQRIADEISKFTNSVQLPIKAIRQELTSLLDAILEQLSTPSDIEERRRVLQDGIDACLRQLNAPVPLNLYVNDDDASLVDDFLTKIVDSRGESELRVERDQSLAAGQIRVEWPGGGLERLIAGRHEALHTIIAGLAGETDANSDRLKMDDPTMGDEA